MQEIRRGISVDMRVVVLCGDRESLEAVFVWCWLQEDSRVSWNYACGKLLNDANEIRGTIKVKDPAWH